MPHAVEVGQRLQEVKVMEYHFVHTLYDNVKVVVDETSKSRARATLLGALLTKEFVLEAAIKD